MEVDTRTQEEIFKFIQDLEFVQLLPSPAYLECIIYFQPRVEYKWLF
jgi:hypothetical protein